MKKALFAVLTSLALIAVATPSQATTRSATPLSASNVFSRVLHLVKTVAHNSDDEPKMKLEAGTLAKAGTGAGIVYPGGPGHPSSVYAVKWNSDGSGGWCIDFTLHNPDSSHATAISRVPGMNAEQSRRTMYIINKYVGTTNDAVAAAVAFHTWNMQNEKSFKTWFAWAKKNHHISAKVLKLYNGMLSDSLTHGPHKLSVTATVVLTGETGKGTVMVKASNGKPDPGMQVDTVANDNANIIKQSHRTNGQGLATFTFKRTGLDRVKFTTTLTAPSSTRAWLSNPASGNQRLVLGGAKEKAQAVFSFQKKLKVKVKNKCLENCDGQGTIVDSLCTGGSPVRVFNEGSNGVKRHADFKAHTCGEASFLFPDGTDVTTEYCLLDALDGHCVSDRVPVSVIEAICPEWAQVGLMIMDGCDSCVLQQLAATAPSNTRFYTVWWILPDGSEVRKDIASDGQLKTFALSRTLNSGDSVKKGFDVYLDSGRTDLWRHVALKVTTVMNP